MQFRNILLMSILISSGIGAEEISIPESANHEKGELFLRGSVTRGVYQGEISYDDGSKTTIREGISAYYIRQIGYTLFDNFIIVGETGTGAVSEPTVKANGIPIDSQVTRFNVVSLGAGVVWYLPGALGPFNLYVSPKLSSSQLHYYRILGNDVNGTGGTIRDDYKSKWGVGAGLALGIDFPISQTWHLGLCSNLSLDRPFAGKSSHINKIDFAYIGIGISLTYN